VAVLANQLSTAAPAGLAASVTGSAMAGSAAGASVAVIFMGMTKVQIGLASALAVAFATLYVAQGNTHASLRREISALAPSPQVAAALRAENQQLAATTAEVERLRQDDLELKQLAQRAADVKKANEERTRLARAPAPDVRQQFYDRIRADDARAQQEIERMNREGSVLVDEYKNLVAKSKDATQTPEARAEAETAAKAKLDAAKLKQQEIQVFTQNIRKALSQRVEAFRRAYGDDPNAPVPLPQTGAGRMELGREPADDASQGTREPSPGNWTLRPPPIPAK
jgi:hypothetical protein